ncbi:securin, sister chromatid separation inhibitor [Rhizophlyctis rosea]|uniref:Securin, sister chromatid separation inhibitor n=1 Tax=Rhizophlyctis rosea TaxID=64517 RepID=A0AAD5SBI8_9FUNG|nr:securin, sister chromatid separation inhibitor [Rhizophlyctis rosea]
MRIQTVAIVALATSASAAPAWNIGGNSDSNSASSFYSSWFSKYFGRGSTTNPNPSTPSRPTFTLPSYTKPTIPTRNPTVPKTTTTKKPTTTTKKPTTTTKKPTTPTITPSTPNTPAQPGTSACPSLGIISARGTSEPQSGSRGMSPIFSAITSKVSPLTTKIYNVVYPANTNFATGPGIGAADVLSHLKSQSTKCPNQKFILAGYSQGAMVISQSLSQIAAYEKRVAAVLLFGNPYYDPMGASAAGTAKGTGRKGYGPAIPAAFAGKTRDYCDSGDGVCQGGGVGGITSAHLGYGSRYASNAAAFVAAKVK